MNGKDRQRPDISIVPGQEVDPELLCDFYRKAYPGRRLPEVWRWLYRTGPVKKRTPIVVLSKGKIIAHSGLIPTHVWLNGARYSASWMVDFYVLPEHRGTGLGKMLTREWMDFSDMSVTVGPYEGSLAVLRSMGFAESKDAHLHYMFIRPMDHPYFSRVPALLGKLGNFLYRPMFKLLDRKGPPHFGDMRMERLDEGSMDAYLNSPGNKKNEVYAVHDRDYIKWRLFDSPDLECYRDFHMSGLSDTHFIVKLIDDGKVRSIDLLMIAGRLDPDTIVEMLSVLLLWGMRNGHSYVRALTLDRTLSDRMRRSLGSLVRHPYVCFYSNDEQLFKEMKECRWNWELIDNDHERF